MIPDSITRDQLERILNDTFKEIESITDVRSMTNAQIKRIIKEIVVDHDGNVEIYLRLLSDLGLEKTVPICDDRTQGSDGTAPTGESGALPRGTGAA